MRLRDFLLTLVVLPIGGAAIGWALFALTSIGRNTIIYAFAAIPAVVASAWVVRRTHSAGWTVVMVPAITAAAVFWWFALYIALLFLAATQCAPNQYECPV